MAREVFKLLYDHVHILYLIIIPDVATHTALQRKLGEAYQQIRMSKRSHFDSSKLYRAFLVVVLAWYIRYN